MHGVYIGAIIFFTVAMAIAFMIPVKLCGDNPHRADD